MTDIEQKLQTQIDELEMKQAFQEQTIEELNSALTQQQFLLDKLLVQVRYLAGKVQGSQASNIASESEETPPPHY